MKRINTSLLFAILVLLAPVVMYGQDPSLAFNMESCTNCTANYPTYTGFVMNGSHIASDFGRRGCSDCSKWHRGVDISDLPGVADLGYHIKAIAAGTITRIYNGNDHYKVLVVEGSNNLRFGYGHIFTDTDPTATSSIRTGDMVLAKLTSHNQYFAIIYDPSNTANSYCLTDAPLNPGVSYSMTYTRPDGTVLTFTQGGAHPLRNTVAQGDIIAPMGGSGGFGGIEHVHLYGFVNTASDLSSFQNPDNIRNPLTNLSYTQPTFTNTLEIARGDGTVVAGTGPFYGKMNFKAKVSFNAQPYGSGVGRFSATSPVFDLNKIEIHLKQNYPIFAFSPMKGAYLESKMNYGGRWNSDRYPANGRPANNTTGGDTGQGGVDISQTKTEAATSAGYGDYRKTGIAAHAYGTFTAADAYDEFYFNEYHTRIHENDNFGEGNPQLAFNSTDARYDDDQYQVIVRSVSVKDATTYESTPRTIIIDNFQPFIQKVEVITNYSNYLLAKTAYEHEWQFNSGSNTQTLLAPQTPNDVFVGQDFTVHVFASEGLSSLNISIPTLGINNQPMIPELMNFTWRYNINGANTTTGNHQIILSGTDFAGNSLVVTPTLIPYRDTNGAWLNTSATGQDRNHTFFIEPASCSNSGGREAGTCDLVADFDYSASASNPLNLAFTDASVPPGNIQTWSWNFGDAGSSSNTSSAQNPSHTFSSAGTYTVTLTVGDGTTTDTHSKQVIVTNTVTSVSFTASTNIGNAPLSVTLDGSSNLPNLAGWEWIVTPTTDQVFSPDKYSQSTTLTFNQTGTYTVRLRVNNGSTFYQSPAQTIEVNAANDPIPQFSWTGQGYAYTPMFMNDQSFVSCAPATSTWTFTDPFGNADVQTSNTGAPITFYPIQVGTYTIQLCVQGDEVCGGPQRCVTKTINVNIRTNTIMPDFSASAVTIKKGETIQFTDLTPSFSEIEGRGWWFEHTPGAGYGAADFFDYRDYSPAYSGTVTHTYNTPGTYEVRLTVFENLQFAGQSKTITVEVQDNELNEMQALSTFVTPGGIHDLISISGDYAASFRQDKSVSIFHRTGSTWSQVARLSQAGITGGNRIVMTPSTVAVKTTAAIYVWEKPANGWANMTSATQVFTTPGNLFYGYGMDMSGDRIVSITETVHDGTASYVDTYEKVNGTWTQTADRLSIGYGSNSNLNVALDYGTLIVRQIDNTKANYNQIRIYARYRGFGGSGDSWQYKQTLTRGDYVFAYDADVSNGVIVAVNPSLYIAGAPPREAYVYAKPDIVINWPSGISPTATLTVENPSPLQAATNYAVIEGDHILLKISNQILLYKKPYNGWHSMTETVRIEKTNQTATDWADTEIDVNGNYVGVADNIGNSGTMMFYLFEIEPVLCDDLQTIDNFNLTYGQSIANQKGIVTVGGTGPATVGLGATANFRGVQVTVKNGFKALKGSTVTISSTTCAEF